MPVKTMNKQSILLSMSW